MIEMSRAIAARSRAHRAAGLAGLVVLGALAAFVPAFAGDAAAPPADPVWAATFKDLTDTPQSLGQWKGKVAVVYFWATWCVPCHKETPKLVQLYGKFRDKNLVVIGIALDNADKVRAFAKTYGVDYPIVYGGSDAIRLGRDLGNDVGGIPFTVVIDRDGRVVETIKGDTPEGRLEAILAPLVG